MAHKDFDRHVREALERLEVQTPPTGDWTAMERLLDTVLPSPADEVLRSGLDAPAVPPIGESWALLADRLAEEGLTDEDPFDALTRTGLSAVPPAAVPGGDWEAFSELLDDAEQSGFDQDVHHRLDRYETPYDESTWPAMEERIADTFSIRRRLLRYKVLELGLMLLFLFTLVNTLDIRVDSLPVLLEQIVPGYQATPVEAEPAPARPSTPTARARHPVAALPATPGIPPSPQVRPAPARTVTAAPQEPPSTPTFVIEQAAAGATVADQPLVQALPTAPDDLALAVPEAERPPREKRGLLTALETLFPKRLKARDQDLSDADLVPDYRRRARLRLGMVGSFDRNRVHTDPTSFRLAREMTADQTQSFGYGGGMALDFNYGRIGLSTGILYAHRTYLPAHRGKRIVDGSYVFNERLAQVSYETVQIPLHLRYDVVSRKDWRVYGLGGFALNAVLSTAYDVEWQQVASIGGGPAGSSGPSRSAIQRQSTLLAVDFPDGGFSGDPFVEISYLTANAGLGVEKYLGTGWSVHLQPMYYHSLRGRGLGPLGERIHTWSLQVGAKVDLGKAPKLSPVRVTPGVAGY